MNVEIEIDEKWPIFTLSSADGYRTDGVVIQLPDEAVDRFLMIQEQYDEMQKQLKAIYEHNKRTAPTQVS